MNNKYNVKIMILSIVGLILFMITGCANSEDGASKSNDDGSVTLTLKTNQPKVVDYLVPAFEEKHPDIKIQTDLIETDYTKALQTMITGEDLPDMFTSINVIPAYKLHELGVLHELDDVLADRKDEFVIGTWVPGASTMDDHIIGLPLQLPGSDGTLMTYNKNLLKEAGLSEEDVPKSWDELIEVSKKIMDKTDAYGTYLDINNWTSGLIIRQMATAITPEVSTDWINHHEGRYSYNNAGNVETIEFFKRLFDEGINDPSDLTREPGEGTALFAADKIAFLMDTPTEDLKEYMDEDEYGFANVPTKDGKEQYIGYSGEYMSMGLYVSKDTEHYEEVKEFINFILDEGYHVLAEQGMIPPMAKVMEEIDVPKHLELKANISHRTPDAVLNNVNATKVKADMSGEGTTIGTGEVAKGYISGQITDPAEVLQEMEDDQNKALDDAIKKNKDAGVDIDKSDWQFPDWVPFEDYEEKE